MDIHAVSKFDKGDCVKLVRRPDLGIFKIVSVVVYATEEGAGKIAYMLRQTLFKSGAFGFEEAFTLRGLDEAELEKVEDCQCEAVENGPDITLNL